MALSHRGLARLVETLPAGASLTYLLRDEFVTAESAPLTSPRTAEPGPGTLTLTDTGNYASISVGAYLYTDPGAENRLHFNGPATSRATGRTLYVRQYSDTTSEFHPAWGWATSTPISLSGSNADSAFFYNAANVAVLGINSSFAHTAEVYQSTVQVLRSSGGFSLYSTGTEWVLVWVYGAASSATLYPSWHARDKGGRVDTFRVADLGAPWDDDYGIATDRLAGARSAGDTFTHEADALIEFTVTTLPSSGQAEVFFRVQDASNYWAVTVDSTGALDLDEVVAGSPTQRGTSAAAVSNGSRVVVMAVGTTIKVYVDNGSDINYTSASNFQTETAGELDTEGTGGAVSDIIAWPRTLSGSAAAALNKL